MDNQQPSLIFIQRKGTSMKSKRVSEIEGFENFRAYSVTEEGKVFSHWKRNDHKWEITEQPYRELKQTLNRKGYLEVCLESQNEKHHVRVHRLVALAFIPNTEGKPQINHIDCNKQNNSVSNLEWVTNSENHLHKMVNGLNVSISGDNHYMKKFQKDEHPQCKEVLQISKNGVILNEFKSVKTAGETLGIDRTSISKALKGHIKSAGGFVWKYKNQEGSTTIPCQGVDASASKWAALV